MKFLYPEFLYALALVLIPVIIHLFHFKRYKKVYFSDVSFLKAVQQQAQTKNRLKHLLLLISRILFITFLVLAFAQPYFPDENSEKQQNELHVIIIDNSLSMVAESTEGENFNRALQAAQEIISSYPENHKFIILSTDGFKPKILTKEDALDQLTSLNKEAKQKSVSENLAAFHNFIASSKYNHRYNIFYLSDFQKSTFTWPTQLTDSTRITWIPLTPLPVANLSVDSFITNTPYHAIFGKEIFTAIIGNKGNEDKENASVQTKVNQVLLAPAAVDIAAGDTAHLTFNFENKDFGNYLGEINIEDYPISFDNTYYFAYKVNDKITVSEIGSEKANVFIETLFSGDSLFQYQFYPQNNINYKKLEQSQLIILHSVSELSSGLMQFLKQFTAEGGSLVIFPNLKQKEKTNQLLSQLQSVQLQNIDTTTLFISNINYNDPLMQDVFIKENKLLNLPWVRQKAIMTRKSKGSYVYNILSFKNAQPFLARTDFDKGKVYVFATDAEENHTNFGKHSLFVPVMYNMALQSAGQYLPAFSLNQPTVELPFVFEPEKTILRHDSTEIIPHLIIKGKKTILFTDEINQPGHYLLSDGRNSIRSYTS